MSEFVNVLRDTNWWGIIAATFVYVLFLSVPVVYRNSWEGREYRKQGSAAPSTGKKPIGGRQWWGKRIIIWQVVLSQFFLGVVCGFIGHPLGKPFCVFLCGSAIAVAGVNWLFPLYIRIMNTNNINLLIQSLGAQILEGQIDPAGSVAILITETTRFRDQLKNDTAVVLTVADVRAALNALERYLDAHQLPTTLSYEQTALARLYIDRLTLFKRV